MSRGADAQDARPPAAVETWVGYARGWGEDQVGNHAQVGAGMRFYLSPRVSLSPRVRYARRFETPDDVDEHTELALETALTFEVRRPANARPRIVTPFLLVSVGVGVRRYPETRFSRERTFTGAGLMGVMAGARLFLPFARGRMYAAPEVGYAALTIVPAAVRFGMPLREVGRSSSQARSRHEHRVARESTAPARGEARRCDWWTGKPPGGELL